MHSTVVRRPRTLPVCFFPEVSESASTEDENDDTEIEKSSRQPSKIHSSKESLANTSNLNILSTVDDLSNAEDKDRELNDCVRGKEKISLHDRDIDSTVESISEAGDELILNDGQISSSEVPTLDTAKDAVAPNVDKAYVHPTPHVSSSDNVPASASTSSKRPGCPYGTACYRRNLQHKADFSHPGDEDHEDEEARCSSSTDVNRNKPACWYGTRCYRKNKEHLEMYSHNFTTTGRPARTTQSGVKINSDSDESEELDDFSDSDEYEASFIDDDEETSDDLQSEDDVEPAMLSESNTSEDEEDKKRKK